MESVIHAVRPILLAMRDDLKKELYHLVRFKKSLDINEANQLDEQGVLWNNSYSLG